MTIRPYQEKAITDSLNAFAEYQDVLLVAATGAGKTVMFLEALRRQLQPGKRGLILAHRKELIEQPVERIKDLFHDWPIEVGIVRAELDQCDRPLTIATVQTLQNEGRLSRLLAHGPIDFLVCDEAHHAVAAQYRKVLAGLRAANPAMLHLGVTATPFRPDERGLSTMYQHVADRITIPDLVSARYLVQPRWLGIFTGISLEGVASSNGDFVTAQLAERFDSELSHETVVSAYLRYGEGRPAVAFTVSVAGAHQTRCYLHSRDF